LKKDIKMIVIACNTATAFALEDLKKELDIPILGVIQPGARAAIKSTINNKIGVIGTEGTIYSQAYVKALKQINYELMVTTLACPSFVPMVEKGILEGKQAEKVVSQSLKQLKHIQSIDTLVLGCTHYPLLEKTIQRVIGSHIQIISSSEETAREASAILQEHHVLAQNTRKNEHCFYVTGNLQDFMKIYQTVFKENLEVLNGSTIGKVNLRSEEHTSELQSRFDLVCRLLLEKKNNAHEEPKCSPDTQLR